MDDRRERDRGERERCCVRKFVRKGGRILREKGRRKERKKMETSIGLSPQEHVGVKRFLEGELVEVRQREKGLRGSWHPAVVIGVKTGRRVVEYDELLTDDGREKLTENIPVGKCLDGGKVAARQPWKSPAKRPRALLRPRPPPLPDPSSISWSKGLSVDCYFKDAWWEGVLTEAINSFSRQKKVTVWFPEEEDWESMALKDMRVGQQWDEDTGVWSLKGCVDVPVSRRGNRARAMSLGGESRGFVGRCPDSMQLAISLKIDETSSLGREAEYTSAWKNMDRTLDDADAVISVQLNSPTSAAFTPRQVTPVNGVGADCPSGNDLKDQKPTPLVLRTRILELPPPEVLNSRRGLSREQSSCALPFFGEERDNAGPVSENEAAAKNNMDQGGLVDRERTLRSGALDKDNLILENPILSMVLRRKDTETANGGGAALQEAGRMGTTDLVVRDANEDENRQHLIDSGWNVSQNLRKNGKVQWYYRSPHGCLLGSLASAMGMWKQMNEDDDSRSDDENPTLSDMKLLQSGRSSMFSRGRLGNRRISKEGRRIASHILVEKDDREETDQLVPRSPGHVNGDMICKLGPPAGSNGTLRLAITDGKGFSPPSNLNCKRSALESELIVDATDLNELKRRKVQCPSEEPSEPHGFQATVSNGDPIRGSMGYADVVSPVSTSALIASTVVEFEKSLGVGHPSLSGAPLETRSKKRTCLTEAIKLEPTNELLNARSVEDRSPIRDGPTDHEPRSKKSRVVSNEVNHLSEGKSRKSLAVQKESSRKKGSTPNKGGELKQAKKGAAQVKKSAHVKKGKKSRTPARAGVRLEVLLSAPGQSRDLTLGEGDLTRKRTLLSWLIDHGKVVEHEKVRYLHRKDLHCMLEGLVTRDGILCNCCKKIVTLSVFEAHAGSKLHRPSANIFLDDGRSLSVCQVEALAVKTQNESNCQSGFAEQGTIDTSDDTCGICGDGGQLICCDHCPSTFHIVCMGLQAIPDGDWYCPNCRCASCGGSQFNGDQATFNDLTVLFCHQCECEYHVKCLRARGLRLSTPPEDTFFCGDTCGRIYEGLRSLVGICKPMEGGFSWTLLRSGADDDRKAGRISNTEINAEHDSKLSIALTVMQECFRPMIDPRTKIDIITHVLYNRRSDISRLNYHGFYTMLLERGDELVSVATIRVHGARLAEMPLIGTRFQYRRQGMCRRLMSAIEEMLQSLGVERLVLPAVPELLDTWTGAFGFQPMDESERLQLMDLNIMAFPGTSILYKHLEPIGPVFHEALIAMDQPSCAAVLQPGLEMKHSDASLASPPVIVKRGRGRPPKVKGEITNLNGLALAARVSAVGACKLANSSHIGRYSESPVACHPVTAKRGRGRPPKNKETLFKSSDGVTLAASIAVAAAHELAESGRDARQTFSPTAQEAVRTGAVGGISPLNAGDDQQKFETLPTVLRKKRGRPPRARVNYNSGISILATTANSSHGDQVARFQGGQMQASSAAMDPNVEDTHHTPSQSPSETRFTSPEEKGVDELGNSIFRKTTRSMREVRTPLWLVESANDEAGPVTRDALLLERSCKALVLERECQHDIPPLENSTIGSTKTYERRKSKLSPPSQMEPNSRVQDVEPTYGHLDFFDENDLDPAGEPGSKYDEVSVPIRAFPSQFASRGDHNIPPGTFIPVETIVVNSQPKVESSDEFLIPEVDEKLVEASQLEGEEQSSGGKLLLRLKITKKTKSPRAVCDMETPQPSAASIKLPNGGLLPAADTESDEIGEVQQFDELDQGQLKQPDTSIEPPCVPLTVL